MLVWWQVGCGFWVVTWYLYSRIYKRTLKFCVIAVYFLFNKQGSFFEMVGVDQPNKVPVEKAARRKKAIISLQNGKRAMPEVEKPNKSAKRRARRKIQKKHATRDEQARKHVSAITHKKTARSCNWRSFIANSKPNEKVGKAILDDAKKTGFQMALARKNRKAGLNSHVKKPPEVIEPSISAESEVPSEVSPKVPPETQEHSRNGTISNQIAIDCEMVGVNDGRESMLARVSLVNKYGDCIYDKFVFPKEEVVDYRTHVSGVRPEDLAKGEDFDVVIKEVGEILKGRILVGHAVHNDLKVLHLPHPKKDIRDTAKYHRFREICGGRMAGLKKLAEAVLGIKIQQGEHDSVIDARATMQLYMMYSKEWEEGRRWRAKRIEKEK